MEYFLLHDLGDTQKKILYQNEKTALVPKKKKKQSGLLSNKKNT